MKIDEFYTITQDSHQWILKFEEFNGKLTKDGNPSVTSHKTYHGTLKQALSRYLDNCLKPSEEASEILARIEQAEKNIEKYLEKQ